MSLRISTSIVWLLLLLISVTDTFVARAEQPSASRTIEAGATCTGGCRPSLIRRTDGKLAATWAANDGRVWVQTIDPATESLSGVAVELGTIAMGGGSIAEQPRALAMPDGDLVLISALWDNSVLFARGSLAAARRVAPKPLLAAAPGNLQGVAAAPSADGATVLVMRAPLDFYATDGRLPPTVSLELLSVGPLGENRGPIARWTAPAGFSPRVATCQGNHFVVWQRADDLIVTVIGADGKPSAERRLTPGRRAISSLGPLYCAGASARIFSGWSRTPMSSEELPQLGAAELTTGTGKLKWQTIKLPAPPSNVHVNEGPLPTYIGTTEPKVVINHKTYWQFAKIDVSTSTVQELPLRTPVSGECLPSDDGTRAVCVDAAVATPNAACPNPAMRVAVSFVGEPTTAKPAPSNEVYWAPGKTTAPRAAAPGAPKKDPSVVRCGDKDWDSLRDALSAWCARKPKAQTAAFCLADNNRSILYQATHCTDLPLGCPRPSDAWVPSVNRAEFDAGEWIALAYRNCSVYFTRDKGSMRVTDGDCEGD